jgi:GTP cyclohydrolase I
MNPAVADTKARMTLIALPETHEPGHTIDTPVAERAAELLVALGADLAHIGYLPGERILGLSKFARVVELFARDDPRTRQAFLALTTRIDHAR